MSVLEFTIEATKEIAVSSISFSERFYEPAQKQIDQMAESLNSIGQLTPIMVHPVERNGYRIVVGGTRLRAALKLHWTKIRADIICGHAIDYKIIELTENAARRNLTAQQRKETKAELKRLLREKLATVEASKGGRGNKGGIREAARQMGVPLATAQDAVKAKLTGNLESRSVSTRKPAPDNIALAQAKAPTSIKFTVAERQRVDQYNKDKFHGSVSDCCRKLIRDALDRERY